MTGGTVLPRLDGACLAIRTRGGQVTDNDFKLLKPFQYTRADGRVIPVDHRWLGNTELASIPSYLGWFARRHGRHTPPALLHDQLIPDKKHPPPTPPPVQPPPVEADLEFRQAMRASGVALVKSWVLATTSTRATASGPRCPTAPGWPSTTPSPRAATAKGCVVLFAAGNGNEPVDRDGYASYEKVRAASTATSAAPPAPAPARPG